MYQHGILILNGDKRQKYLYELLKKCGYHVFCEEQEYNTAQIQVLAAPIPSTKLTWEDLTLYDSLKVVVGGVLPQSVISYGKEKKIKVYDYMKDSQLIAHNAVSTAEGAVAEAVMNQDCNIYGNKSIVIGYGNCGKEIVKLLSAMGSQVTVAVRREKVMREILAAGLNGVLIERLSEVLAEYPYIFNTVPAMIFPESLLNCITPGSCLIDIASNPGGVDYDAARRLGVTARLSLGIPGRYAAKSAACAMKQFMVDRIGDLNENINGRRQT